LTGTGRARTVASALVGCLLVLPACAPRRPLDPTLPATGSFGVYKGTVIGEEGRGGRFRLFLYAELPDRIHAEVLPPVGGPRLVLDGGGGKLAVALVEERVAYVGDAGAESVGRVIGAPISLAFLVSALLGGCPPGAGDVVIRREPPEGPGLPSRFELRRGATGFEIERRGGERIRTLGAGLGSGTPPGGFTVLPLDDLRIEEGSLLDRQTRS
jgi:hypothetical protein